jgi:hypothetical protein
MYFLTSLTGFCFFIYFKFARHKAVDMVCKINFCTVIGMKLPYRITNKT